MLEDPDASAVALMRALKVALGDFLAWEPESIWLDLERAGAQVPAPGRARVMAALALRLVPSFYWDAIVFEKTAVALAGALPSPGILEEAHPAWLAWAVLEARWLLQDAGEPTWEFQHEPKAYAGVVLARAGFALAPDQLEFAQGALDRARGHGPPDASIKRRWESVRAGDLSRLSLAETQDDVHVARLAAIELHVRDRKARMERDVARLR